MSLPILSAIVAHKLVAAIVVASLVTSGGVAAAAVNSGHISNIVGDVSFTINPSYVNVTSLAYLNLGTLNPGQTGTQSSTAKVNVTVAGTYGIELVNRGVIQDAFAVFNVTVTGLGSTPVVLSLIHPSQLVTIGSTGIDTLTVSLLYTVNIGQSVTRGITATNEPFVEMFNNVPITVPPTTTTHSTSTTTTTVTTATPVAHS